MHEHKISTASGIASPRAAVGDYMRLGDGAPDCTIEITEAEEKSQRIVGSKFTLSAGDSIRLNGTYTNIMITQSSGLSTIVNLLCGFGEMMASRINGTVNTINDYYREKESLSGNAYNGIFYLSGITNQTGNGVNRYGVSQLWNPVGSGKNLIIDEFGVRNSSPDADFDIANQHHVIQAFSGSYEVVEANENITIKNSKSTGQASVVSARGTATVGTVINLFGAGNRVGVISSKSFDAATNPDSSEVKEKEFKSPIIIEPGYGFSMASNSALTLAATQKIHVYARWREKNI